MVAPDDENANEYPNLEPFDGVMPQVDPTAFVHRTAVVIGRVRLAAEVSIWPNVTLRGDEGEIVIGAGSNIQDGSTVHATGGRTDTHVGARVTVGHNVVLHGCRVEDDCLVGMGSILLDECVIGRGSFVGAGSLVTGRTVIPPGSLVFGNPARVVRPVTDGERASIAYGWRHYVENARKYAARGR